MSDPRVRVIKPRLANLVALLVGGAFMTLVGARSIALGVEAWMLAVFGVLGLFMLLAGCMGLASRSLTALVIEPDRIRFPVARGSWRSIATADIVAFEPHDGLAGRDILVRLRDGEETLFKPARFGSRDRLLRILRESIAAPAA